MLVLVLRPQDAAARTAVALSAMGHEVVISPVLEVVSTGAAWPAGVIDAVIAASARAFEYLYLSEEFPPPETRRLLPLFLVGEKTADTAKAYGFTRLAQVAADAKSLAPQIIERVQPTARALYLAGHERKSLIEDVCDAAGITLEVIETYTTQSAPYLSEYATHLLASGAIGAALHYSRRSAEIFLKLAADAAVYISPLLHVAISDDAATPLREALLPHIAVAATPDEPAMLALLAAKAG